MTHEHAAELLTVCLLAGKQSVNEDQKRQFMCTKSFWFGTDNRTTHTLCGCASTATSEPATLRETCLPRPTPRHQHGPGPRAGFLLPAWELKLCPMGLSAVQILELLQNFQAAAPGGSRNQAPHMAVPSYAATSQQTLLHMMLQLQPLFKEKALGRVGGLQATEVLRADQTPLIAPCLPPRQEV